MHNKRLHHLLLVFLAALTLPIIVAGCSEEKKQMAMPPAAVQIATVEAHKYREKTNYVGTVKSRKSITLYPNNIDGHVVKIEVTGGQAVKKGQLLMQIDSRMQSSQTDMSQATAASALSDLNSAKATLISMQNTLRSKQSNVSYTKAQRDRYQTLCKEGAVSKSDLDNWQNNYLAAEGDRDAVLEQIEAQKATVQKFYRTYKQTLAAVQMQKSILSYYDIRAPFTGIVGDIPIKLGDHVSTQTALTTVTENHPLEVYTNIPSEKAAEVRLGMNVALTTANGKNYGDSKVFFISPVVDSNSQTVLIKSMFPNEKNELRADQTVTSQIVWDEKTGITVPTSAVTQAAGKYFVFVAKQNGDKGLAAHQTEITIYEIDGNSYQVKSGLKSGDKVVLTGIQRLGDGAPIVAKSGAASG